MTQTVPLAHLRTSKPSAAEASSRKTLHGIALAVAKAKRIVVVTGAGISCSSGIPDFRSSDGLYNLVKERYPDVVMKGRDLFDAALFRDPMSAAVFYTFMAELKTQIDSAHPAPVHDFLAMLDDKGKLLRSYTQNIDGLEERAGLGTQDLNTTTTGNASQRAKNVQLHGDIHRVRCTLCSASYPCSPDHIAAFRTGVPPDCPECIARSDARTARSARALKCGTLRPAIVLYDEPHPLGDHIGAVQTSDLGKRPDLLIVMGTSLKVRLPLPLFTRISGPLTQMKIATQVHGLRLLVKSFAKAVHSSRPCPSTTSTTSQSFTHNVLFVNRTPPPPGEWTSIIDYHIQGDADTWVSHVLGEWKKSRPGDWEVQMRLDEVVPTKGEKLNGGKEKAKGDKTKDNKTSKGKGVKGKDVNVKAKAGKPKAKAPNSGSENQPPPTEVSDSKARITITLRRKAKVAQSPLHSRSGKIRGVGKGKPGLVGKGKAPLGTPTPMMTPARQASLATPAKSSDLPAPSFNLSTNPALNLANMYTPMRPGQKRSAPSHSPFVPGTGATPHTGQIRLDAMFSRSPAHKRPAISTPTAGRPFRAQIIPSPVNPTFVRRSPGYVSGLLRGERVASGSGSRMDGNTMTASASEAGMETTASETGALASASGSDAEMDTTDVDGPPKINPVANFEIQDLAAQSSADESESEAVDQEEDADEEESDESEESDGAETEDIEEVGEETITLSQRMDLADSEDMIMDSPDEMPGTVDLISSSGSISKPLSRASTSTQASHVSSQTSHASTQDSRFSSHSTQESIFSAQGSQDTPASSQEEGPIFESSQTTTRLPGSSQTITCPSPQASLDLSQTITCSPPPSIPLSPERDKSRRYLGQPRPAPFKSKSSGSEKLFKERPLARHVSMGTGSASTSTRHVSNPKPPRGTDVPARRSTIRSASANWSIYHTKSGARRPGGGLPIPIPGVDVGFSAAGVDVGFSASGERFHLTSSSPPTDVDSDSEEEVPLAHRNRVLVTVPSPPASGSSSSRQSSEKRELKMILSPNMAPKDDEPRKRNRLKDDSDSDVDDDRELPRGLLFSSLKGKQKKSDNEMVIDVDPTSDEEDDGLDGAVGHMSLDGPSTDPDPDVEKGKQKKSDNEMVIDVDPTSDEDDGLDGAVGHMSLDGPSTDPDPDVDVVGMSSGAELSATAAAASPIQTRARRRVKEATAAAVSKRGKRAPPRTGIRTSSRLAAMSSTS
ncbi:unnamed protein product [Rhizoctonia solani]|uniref:Deacetylase sirtuin-type domain-containing protein n=1 Tax=Rhizoctonia solani TaxID=456999 RepID=A0A8H2X945_9AGAM|nr:unnamed protein product [Rhizoctonia solani]